MNFRSFLRNESRPSIHFVPASDFFNRLHDPHYRTLDELRTVAPSPSPRSSLPPAAQPHWQTLPPFQHYE